MKRFFIYFLTLFLIIFLVLIIFFNKISNFTKIKLKSYISQMLPEGSTYGNINIDFFETYVENIKIENLGSAKRIIIRYSPIDLLLRKIRCICIEEADLTIETKDNLEKKEFKFPNLKVDQIKIMTMKFKFKGNPIIVNSNLSLASKNNRVLIRIKKLNLLTDYIDINEGFGDISISEKIFLNLYSIKSDNSSFKISGTKDSLFLKGELSLKDLKNSPVNGNLTFNLFYKDKEILVDGNISEINYKDNSLKDVKFRIKNDKIYFFGENFKGELKGITSDKRDLKIRFNLFDLSKVNKRSKETIFSGDLFISMDKRIFDFKSSLKGIFYGISSDTIILEGNIGEGKINIDRFYSSKGSITSQLSFSIIDSSIIGYINCKDIPLNEQCYFNKIFKEGLFSCQLYFSGNASIGSIWLENVKGKNINVNSLGVSFEIDDIKNLKGNLDILSSEVSIYGRKIDNIYFTGLINGFDFNTKGLVKSDFFILRTELTKNNNIFQIDKINIFTSYDTIFSISPTRIIFNNGNLNITGFSLSNGGNFKTGLNLALKRNGEIDGGISILNLNLREIKKTLNSEVSGFLDIVMSISGNLKKPSYTVTMKGRNISEEYPFGDSLSLFLSGDKEKAEVIFKIFERNKSSEIFGEYNFKEKFFNGDVELNSASNWVLIFFKEFVRVENADISGNVKFSGSGNFPEIYGNLNVKNINIIEKNTGITVYNLKGNVICNKDSLYFNDFKGGIGNGELIFNGVYKIRDKKYSLYFNINNGFIAYDYYTAGFNCNVNILDDLKGTKIIGDVSIKEATVTVPFYFKEGGKKFNNLYINLNVNANDGNVWLKNENADIEFSGDAKIFYDWGIPSAIGEFKILQGNFKYIFTEFKIEEGKFIFSKRGEIDPEITFISTHLAETNDTIILSVSGSMKKPEFNIYSRPYKDLSEIILVLGLNMSWQELLNFSSVNNTFTNTAFRAFDFWARSRLQTEFSKLLGMDVARFEKYESYKLTLGKYIAKNLYFQIGTEFYPTAKFEYNAEYRFSKWGTIKYQDTMDSRSAILRFTIRY